MGKGRGERGAILPDYSEHAINRQEAHDAMIPFTYSSVTGLPFITETFLRLVNDLFVIHTKEI